jgi:hypothetical protein
LRIVPDRDGSGVFVVMAFIHPGCTLMQPGWISTT